MAQFLQSENREIEFLHEVKLQVRFDDLDVFGHVNNSVYQNYYDFARIEYFQDIFQHKITEKKFKFILAHVTIDFINQVFFEDFFYVHTKVVKIGKKSLTMLQQLVSTDRNTIYSKCTAIMVGFDYKKGVSIVIPDDWRKRMRKKEQNPHL